MSTPQAQTTTEQNKQIILRWFEEVWNQGRRETIADLYALDGVLYDGAVTHRGREDFYLFYDGLRSQFSEFQVKPLIALAEGDLASSIGPPHFATRRVTNVYRSQALPSCASRMDVSSKLGRIWDQADLAAQLAR